MTLIYLSAAWVAGVYLGSRIPFSAGIICLGLLPFCLIPFFRQHTRLLFLAGFCFLTLLGGSIRFQTSLPVINEHHIQFYNNKGIVEIKGMVCTEHELRNTTAIFQLSAVELQTEGGWKKVQGKVLIRVPRYKEREYYYGDILRLTGGLQTPPQYDEFDYKGYLARHGIYSIMNYPKIEIIDTGKGFKPLSWIHTLRSQLSQSLSLALPEPQASLAQGILLGLRGNIPYSLKETFTRTGTAHLLAISGLHLSIIIGIFLSLGISLFGRRYYIYIWLALLVIWLYALITGMRPPVVRGAVMGSMFLFAEYLGRQRTASTALAFAAALMIGIEPHVMWDASFQLSFLAMAGLLYISPYLQAWGRKGVASISSGERTAASFLNNIVDSFAITLSAILATWPVIAYYFGIVSFVGPQATLLALLFLPGIIVTTALVGIAGLFAPLLAHILGSVAWLFLTCFILVVQAFDTLPFSSLQFGSIHVWQILLYYVLLALATTAIKYRKQLANSLLQATSKISHSASKATEQAERLSVKWVLLLLFIVTALVWTVTLNLPDNKLHVNILDVGQGDAILIQTPSRQNILIDGGPDPQAISLALGERLPFWVRNIDLVVLTQPQADHLTGLIAVLQKYKVSQVIEPDVTYTSSIYQHWRTLIKSKKIEHKIAHAGQEISLGNGIRMEIIHPPSSLLQNTSHDIDNNGLVLRLSWNKISFLFTADIHQEAEWYLTAQRANLKSTVLKVAHHGSRTSTTAGFLAVVDPEIAVISVGAANRFGLPHAEVLNRLTKQLGNKIYLTSNHGTTEFITDGQKLWVKCSKSYPEN